MSLDRFVQDDARACAREGCDEPLPPPIPLPWGGDIQPRLCPTHAEQELREEERQREADAITRLVESSGIPRSMRQWGMTTYPLLDTEGQRAFRVASSWLDRYARGERDSLYLHGPVGVGKTGLVVGMIRYLTETGTEAMFVNWRDLLTQTREAISGGGMPLARPRRVPVLALDDLGAERPTEWAMEELASLLQRRIDNRLPLLVTSNFTPDAIMQRLGGGIVAERIIDRMFDGTVVHQIGGRSRRRGWKREEG